MMLVNQETFEKLLAEAVPAPASALNAKVVSLRHLLALKCHAIKHGHPGRVVKDVDDVIRLAQANGLDLNDLDSVPLEFPDWSGMDDRKSRLGAEAAFDLCEQYGVWFPELRTRWRAEEAPKCTENSCSN